MRLISAVIACGGILGAIPIVYSQIQGVPCPKLGPVPACYIVLGAYALILVASFLGKPWRAYVFLPPWLVVFAIAGLATGLEVLTPNTCPKSRFGVPSCYLSLVIAVLLGIAYVLERKADRDFAFANGQRKL